MVNNNGNHNENNGRAGLGDMFMSGEGSGGFDPIKELLTGSPDAHEFLPRTRYTEKEIARDMRIIGRRQRKRTGSTNVEDLIWYKRHAVIGLNGEGRKEAVQMVSGIAAMKMSPGMWQQPSFIDKFRTPSNKREAPQA